MTSGRTMADQRRACARAAPTDDAAHCRRCGCEQAAPLTEHGEIPILRCLRCDSIYAFARGAEAAGWGLPGANTAPPSCKLCGASTRAHFARNSFPVLRCDGCGFMFARRLDGQSALALYNDERYLRWERYRGWWEKVEPFYLRRLERIAALAPQAGSLLDVGCAEGYFLRHARTRGFQVAGVDVSEKMRRRAEQIAGCPVYASLAEVLGLGLRFDCVTMFEVIEHLEEPLGAMREVARLLSPSGLLALSTPNCQSPQAPSGAPMDIWFIAPLHISYFGRQTLADCLVGAGLEVVALEGLSGFCAVMAGDAALPRWLERWLRPLRRGKRLRPGGLLGDLMRRAYRGRLDICHRSHPGDLETVDILEAYARKPQ